MTAFLVNAVAQAFFLPVHRYPLVLHLAQMETNRVNTADLSEHPRVVSAEAYAPLGEVWRQLADIRGVLEDVTGIAGPTASRMVNDTLNRIESHPPLITILGREGTGKTALVNALAGFAALLPTGVANAASVPVRLGLNMRGSDRVKARLHYFAPSDWERLARSSDQIGLRSGRDDAAFGNEQVAAIAREALGLGAPERVPSQFASHKDAVLLDALVDPLSECDDPQRPILAEFFATMPGLPGPLVLVDTPELSRDPIGERLAVMGMRSAQTCVLVLSRERLLTAVDVAALKILRSPSRHIFIFVNGIGGDPDDLLEDEIRADLAAAGLDIEVPILFGFAEEANRSRLELVPADAGQRPDAPRGFGIAQLAHVLSESMATHQGARFVDNVLRDCTTIFSLLEDGMQGADEPVPTEVDFVELNASFDRLRTRLMADFDAELEAHLAQLMASAEALRESFVETRVESCVAKVMGGARVCKLGRSMTRFRLRLSALTGRFNAGSQRSLRDIGARLEEEIAALQTRSFNRVPARITVTVPKAGALARANIAGPAAAIPVPEAFHKWWLPKALKARQARRFYGLEIESLATGMMLGLDKAPIDAALERSRDSLARMLEAAMNELLRQAGADWTEFEDEDEAPAALRVAV